MSDKGKIYGGLVAFVVVLTSPFWLGLATGSEAARPKLKMPAEAKQCVESVEYMRASHMELLDEWRDMVVRQGQREYVAWTKTDPPNGLVECPAPGVLGEDGACRYRASLTHTCLGCHGKRADFCSKCHLDMGFEPYCWDCHVEPKGE